MKRLMVTVKVLGSSNSSIRSIRRRWSREVIAVPTWRDVAVPGNISFSPKKFKILRDQSRVKTKTTTTIKIMICKFVMNLPKAWFNWNRVSSLKAELLPGAPRSFDEFLLPETRRTVMNSRPGCPLADWGRSQMLRSFTVRLVRATQPLHRLLLLRLAKRTKVRANQLPYIMRSRRTCGTHKQSKLGEEIEERRGKRQRIGGGGRV